MEILFCVLVCLLGFLLGCLLGYISESFAMRLFVSLEPRQPARRIFDFEFQTVKVRLTDMATEQILSAGIPIPTIGKSIRLAISK